MQSFVGKVYPEGDKKENNGFNYADSSPLGESGCPVKEDIEISSSEDADGSLIENTYSSENAQNQLVVYEPLFVHDPKPLNYQPPPFSRKEPSKALPVVEAFTVQCANCFQWRLIPTEEKYEEIRENIVEKPFYCETASEWRPGVSCDDPGDIQQDNSRLWAIDKPSIARPPPGWQRLLRIRGEGSIRFADVYYVAPSGKRFRSLVEIQKYLSEIPELAAGINMSQFSFLIPKPLQEDYVKKRPSGLRSSRPAESGEASPIAWAADPVESVDLNLIQPEPYPSSHESPVSNSSEQPAKKRAKKSSTAQSDVPLS